MDDAHQTVEAVEEFKTGELPPQMAADELVAFAGFLRASRIYLEFGSGGTTLVASQLVRQAVISVDSYVPWIRYVDEECRRQATRITPVLVHPHIGPVGRWGFPLDPSTREHWPLYYTSVWEIPGASDADLCLIDGRFRVASFLTALTRCSARTHLLFHDFAGRSCYDPILAFATEVFRVGTLSAFQRKPDIDMREVSEALTQARFDPK
jgi:hypothetical protein